MFSKKTKDSSGTSGEVGTSPRTEASAAAAPAQSAMTAPAAPPKAKTPPSVISSDLHIEGNLKTTGDIQFEGQLTGDVQAHLLSVGEKATIRGEVRADDIVIDGRVIGKVCGLKVRLTSTSHVEGDIIHKTIAIENGARFDGTVKRHDEPLGNAKRVAPAPSQPAPGPASAPQRPAPEAKPSEPKKS